MARLTSFSRLPTTKGDRTTHVLTIVQQLVRSCRAAIHATRLTAILPAVAAAVRSRRLTLTEPGRVRASAAHVKHSIKRIDRLLGNRHLATERFTLYQVLVRRLVGALVQPLISTYRTGRDITVEHFLRLDRAAFVEFARSMACQNAENMCSGNIVRD